MGKVTLDEKFKSYTGALPPNGHRFYLTKRYGETVISHCPKKRDPATISAKQKASSELLKQARAIADAELADDAKHEQWRQKWHLAVTVEGRKYKTLRGFVIAEVRKTLKQP